MVHRHIVLFCHLFLLRLVLDFQFWDFSVEYRLPLFAKDLFRYKLVLFDASLKQKHGGVAIPKLEVDFAHVPLEGGLVKGGEVLGKHFQKLVADVFEHGEVVLAVELEGTVHDATVVEGGDYERVARFGVTQVGRTVGFVLDAAHGDHRNNITFNLICNMVFDVIWLPKILRRHLKIIRKRSSAYMAATVADSLATWSSDIRQ